MATKRVPEDLSGRPYGRLTVIAFAEHRGAHRIWLCRCECGKQKPVYEHNLRNGSTQACGCLRLERVRAAATTHGESWGKRKTVEYTTWRHILARCASEPNYVSRGITVCDEWKDYPTFLKDMGRRPSPRHSIERVDNDKGYSKSNCIWATALTQINNRRTTVFVDFKGERLPFAEACRRAGIKYDCAKERRDRGWPEERWFDPPGWHWRHSLR